MNKNKTLKTLQYLLIVFLFAMPSCGNINHDLDSVLNYPNAVVTKLDFDATDGDVKYYIRLLRRSEFKGRYEYVDIQVSKYEFDLYNIGDTIHVCGNK